jgi:YD repeat-containing protein
LDEIISPEAIVKFAYGNRDDFTYLKRLTGITIAPVHAPASAVKSIQFTHGYFGSTSADKRLRLNEVTVTAPGVTQSQKYRFVYESQSLPPYPMKMDYPAYSHPTYSEDFWGYYNAAKSTYLIPREFIADQYDKKLYGGDRHANSQLDVAKACMLKEISYPTGGRTVFQFERAFGTIMANTGGSDGGEYIGGFRVNSITNYDGITGVANTKTYEYISAATRPIRKEDFWYDQRLNEITGAVGPEGDSWQTNCWYTYTREMLFSSPLLPLEVAPGMPIMYTSVTEYNGTKTNNAGKTVYLYNPPYSPSDYYSWEHPYQYEMPFHYHPYHRDKGNYSPELVSKTEYAFNGTTYRPVSRVANTYTQLYTQEFLTGIKLSRPERYGSTSYFSFFNCGTTPDGLPACGLYPVKQDYIESIIALDTKAYQESSLLAKTERYAFDPLDPSKYTLATTEYTYNEKNLAIREQSTHTSAGEVLKTTYKYPHDFSAQAPYSHMVNAKHIWSPVIESSTYKNSTSTVPLESTKMRYDFWNGSTDQVYPVEVSTRPYNSSVYEPRVQYLAYDKKGNVLSVSKAGDVPTAYVWGYDGQQPIAETRNAVPVAVAYTSFEWNSPGGWSYALGSNNANLVYSAARTGRVSYRLDGSGGVRRESLPAGDYELLFWAQSATRPAVNHSGTLVADQRVAQAPSGWYQYRLRLRLANAGYVSLDVSAGTVILIDEVRLHPVSAKMTSYTYDPLVGMTSKTGPDGRTIFHEYDALGRLLRTRDEQGRILSQQQYHYVQQ